MKCVECEKPLSQTHLPVIYNDDFVVCKPCHDQTTADWEEDKKMLRAQGHMIPCKRILELTQEEN